MYCFELKSQDWDVNRVFFFYFILIFSLIFSENILVGRCVTKWMTWFIILLAHLRHACTTKSYYLFRFLRVTEMTLTRPYHCVFHIICHRIPPNLQNYPYVDHSVYCWWSLPRALVPNQVKVQCFHIPTSHRLQSHIRDS